VAYWNLPHRPLTRDDGGEYHAAGEPLRFFHFSGYSPEEPQVISKHQTRLGWGTIGAAAQSLFDDYRQRLLANGFRDTSKWPCAYDRFLDGPEIPPCCRTYYQRRLLGDAGLDADPFATSAAAPTVYDALQSPVGGGPVTGAALALYDCRPDLQQVFPRVPGSDCLEYARWFVQDGAEQAGIDPAFVEPVHSLLAWESRPAGMTATTTFSRGFPSAAAAVARRIFRWAQKQRRLAGCFSPKLRHKVRKILEGVAFPSPINHRPRAPAHVPPTASPGTLKMGINLFGFLERPTGLGMAARAMAECFQAATLPCHPIPLDERAMLCGEPLPPTVWPDEQLAINYCHLNADCTASLVHVFGHKPFAGHFNIGFWAWELEEFPTRWDHMFDLYQEIWVPSCFVQQAVSQRARIPVVRIPHGVAVAPPDRDYRDYFALPRNRPAVLVMFDTGSFSERKNPLAAIHAVKRAAAAGHDPLLVIKIGRPELQAPLLQELAREVRHVDCKIIHGWLSRKETLGLISACDLLVSLHRSEGFGLILAEAMGLGKPVVATGYSGNMDFMNTANSFLVNYALTTLDRDIGPYPAGFRWAEPDIRHAADLIGRILEDPRHAAAVGRRAAGDIAAQLSPEAVGRQIRQRLNLLGFSAAGNPRHPLSASAHFDSGVMKMLPGEKVATLDVSAV